MAEQAQAAAINYCLCKRAMQCARCLACCPDTVLFAAAMARQPAFVHLLSVLLPSSRSLRSAARRHHKPHEHRAGAPPDYLRVTSADSHLSAYALPVATHDRAAVAACAMMGQSTCRARCRAHGDLATRLSVLRAAERSQRHGPRQPRGVRALQRPPTVIPSRRWLHAPYGAAAGGFVVSGSVDLQSPTARRWRWHVLSGRLTESKVALTCKQPEDLLEHMSLWQWRSTQPALDFEDH
eukprot:CAMPEP_0181212470 /NCGR_PEP_ID=MMETSP1096-20121128/24364_1 /TAXON_ID=156174 ORGANISM="Chrysochromulina ericina, Strain CCMP281" /NCGR_SAMPLE_ID=MMETSP1096 /ASSEMBLY_ACC=CAM_ASM_000453 /LENGTH=237 /DNA_ID=CAMNT_0023303995 /DNA_START=307 /DNA_END=1020 /DNA_ORIENTATION=-